MEQLIEFAGNHAMLVTAFVAVLPQVDDANPWLGVPHVELDAHFHQAGWTPTPAPEFRAAVREALDAADGAAGGWVVWLVASIASVLTVSPCLSLGSRRSPW